MSKKTDLDRLGIDIDKDLVQSVVDAVAEMSWLTASDAAMVSLALQYAKTIVDAIALAEECQHLAEIATGDERLQKRIKALEARADVTKVVGYVGSNLAVALRALGGAPSERKALVPDTPKASRLAALRDARSA